MDPIIQTTNGPVRGLTRGAISLFRSIPYGRARRFCLPEAPAPWIAPRDCTVNGPIAPQQGGSIGLSRDLGPYFTGGHPERFALAGETTSEDCLSLHVLTPGLTGKRPVIVYLHGGGYLNGSGALVQGADDLALEEDVVLVGVNHRLNLFGFLYLGAVDPAYRQSGMAGMHDLVLALRWVRENIAAFGGDPDCVTILGESGGGGKVALLMAMPEARGLFHRAVVESGVMPVDHVSPEDGARAAARVMAALGVSTVEGLQAVPAERLLSVGLPAFGGRIDPVADGISLPYSPERRVRVFPAAREVPLLVGSSLEEMAVLDPGDVFAATEENYREKLTRLCQRPYTAADPDLDPEALDAALETLPAAGEGVLHRYARAASMTGVLGVGAAFLARAKARQGGAPVYQYFVTRPAPFPVRPAFPCAWHTAELPLQMRLVLHPEQEAMSRAMAHALAAFARTGSPATETLPWPPYEEAHRRVMVFGEAFAVQEGLFDALLPLIRL